MESTLFLIVLGVIGTIVFICFCAMKCVKLKEKRIEAEVEKEKLKFEAKIYASKQATELIKKLLDIYKAESSYKEAAELIELIRAINKIYNDEK